MAALNSLLKAILLCFVAGVRKYISSICKEGIFLSAEHRKTSESL